jgi:2-keto-4-pentenoate hydratase/2-oxohepta-3-ene-1,7-dioic acid hydratase in catechol pathway
MTTKIEDRYDFIKFSKGNIFMKILSFSKNGQSGLAVQLSGRWHDLSRSGHAIPDDIGALLRLPEWQAAVTAAAAQAPELDLAGATLLPPVRSGEKILCVGLNYLDHVAESPYKQPDYPTFFPRVHSSLVAHEQPIVKPRVSEEFDYEGELVAVIGREGRHIPHDAALEYVAGYSIFNEASVRDYQFKSPQWTMGKNFDGSGAFGPWFVSADELPPGAKGLELVTRVNGVVKQKASTSQMLFDVATLVALASEVMTLRPGDLIVTGTPAGVGFGMKPPVYLNAGDICEVEIERIGTLRNTVVAER